MKATSRGSAPKSPAISIMAEAPPGAVPQMAVVPGSTLKRVSSQPMAVLVPRMARPTPRKSGQFLRNVATASPVMDCATRQPTMVCEAIDRQRAARGSCRRCNL